MAALRTLFQTLVLALFTLLIASGAADARDAAIVPAAKAQQETQRETQRETKREIESAALPREAREVLSLIRAGGPFPYRQDGSVFGNREKQLPTKQRGYYLEYTVRTPGSRDRGARRIVAGRDGEFYYSDDHYQSFRRIRG
ncbi:MAG: ribonuclease N [Betaproteobacteria bacterium]|nr:ribonuclease N [Betaproteobacteria bacterium]